MGKVSNIATRIFFDQFDVSGVLNSAQLQIKQQASSVACFGDVGPRKIVGNYDHDHQLTGFFDPGTGGVDSSIDKWAAVTFATDADHFLAELFGANAEGSLAYDSVVELAEVPRSAKIGSAVLLNLHTVGRGQVAHGHVLRNATLGAAGTGSGVDDGTTNTGQIWAVVYRLIAFTGTSITLTIEDSADNASFAAIGGLANSGALTVASAVRATTATATRRYKHVVAAGTFSSAQVLVTGGYVAGS